MNAPMIVVAIAAGLLHSMIVGAQPSAVACSATATSITPASYRIAAQSEQVTPKGELTFVSEIPLPGSPNRFDYQSVDTTSGRIYMNHMNSGTTIVFDAVKGKVITEIPNVPRATGVWAVPAHHQVYISAAGSHEVVVIDDSAFKVVGRVGNIRFPDGIAYAAESDKVFVSDESGNAVVVIDAKTLAKRSTIALGGEAGNTHYDAASHCILVTVQTKNEWVAIDPVTERIVHRYELPGSDGPHGFALDEVGRLAFITSEGNAALQVVDLRTMKVVQTLKVASGPDVLAWDAAWRRLYVASESGAVSAFWLNGSTLRVNGVLHLAHAHTVSVDPRTHRVYLPLEDIKGKPVLQVYAPAK